MEFGAVREEFPVPWTTMSWSKLAWLRCLQSIEEQQLRLSQVPLSDAEYELSQLASRVTSAMHADVPKRRRSFREGQEFDS